MRYQGQNYEQEVAVPAGAVDDAALAELYASYGRLYEGFYGYRLDGIPIELVRLSVVATGEPPTFASLPSEEAKGEGPERREVFFPGSGFVPTDIVRRRSSRPRRGALRPPDRRVDGLDGRRPTRLDADGDPGGHPRPHTRMIDPVTLAVVNNALVNICREMGITMIRTAFSPIFNEGLDFSCVLFDRRGNMIGQAEFCPAQIAASLFIVRWTLEELGVDSFEPGDVVLHNDPYRGGAHIPEHAVIRPVFHEGELFGFVANVGHLAEIGGKAVGSFAADATEVFQEGLRIPPVKIVKRDVNDMDLWRLIMANHRTPRNTWGDLNAQIGSLRVAERRVIELLDRFGRDVHRRRPRTS